MQKIHHKTVDEYLDNQPRAQRTALIRLRKIILKLVPDAEEVISYNMPAYKYHGMLVGFAAFKNHCSLYLWKGGVVAQFADDLKNFETSEGTIRFTAETPLPESVVNKIVLFRKEENLSKKKKRTSM